MRNDCNIIKDLLPLYIESIASSDTVAFINEHLDGCEHCRAELEAMKSFDGKDPTLYSDKPEPADEALPVRRLKRKLMRRIILTVIASVLLTAAILILCIELKPADIYYGSSEMYTREDMDGAIKLIEEQLGSFEGCKLYSISYTDDRYCQSELEYCNSLSDNGTEYSECIVFVTDFRSPVFGGGSWTPNCRYSWYWYLARTESGVWELITWGVP